MKRVPAFGLLLGIWFCATSPRSEAIASLTIDVSRIRNRNGPLRLALFQSPAGYPEQTERALRTLSVPIEGATTTVILPRISPGTYALAVLHDENGNGKLDRNFLGVPLEGVGASNAAAERLGPPRFEDARFTVSSVALRLPVSLVYWL